MKKTFFNNVIISLMIFIISSGLIQSQTSEALPVDPSVKIGKLSNGLTYYIKKNIKPEKRAELRLIVKVGSVCEDDDQKGLAHFCEHMAFNGTKNFPKKDLVNFVESIGMQFGPQLNAYTNFDETVYMLQVPTDKQDVFEKGMNVIKEWSQFVSYEDIEIDKERGVILEEERGYRSAEERISRKQLPVSYFGSKYAERDIIGDTSIIAFAKYDVFKRFYRDWYRPDLMAVVVVGDVQPDDVEKLIKSLFSELTMPEKIRPREKYPVPGHDNTLISIESDKELSFPTITMTILHPEKKYTNQLLYKEHLKNDLATSMINARLNEFTNKPNPPFQFGYSYYSTYLGDKDALSMFAMAKGDDVMYSFDVLLTELYKAFQTGFNQTEMDRTIKESIRYAESNVLEKDKTESSRIVYYYISNFLNETPIISPEQRLELMKKLYPTINLEEVYASFRNLVTDKNIKILISSPDKKEIKIPTKDEISNKFNSIKTKKYEKYDDIFLSKPLFDKEVKPGKITNIKDNKVLDFKELTLSNGAKVILKKTDFKNDEVILNAFSPGGTSLMSDKDFISGNYSDYILNQSGTGNYNENDFNKYMTGKIASVYTNIGEISENMGGSCSPQDIELFMQLLHLKFSYPRYDEEAFTSFINKMQDRIKDSQNSPESVYYDSISCNMSNYHYRRLPLTLDFLSSVDHKKAYQLYKERFADASDFVFIFVGSFDFDIIKPLIEKYVASLPALNRKETWKDVGVKNPAKNLDRVFNIGADYKSNVDIRYYGDFEYNAKNLLILRGLQEIMDIRFREEIREEKGGTYGVGIYSYGSKFPKQEYNIYISWGCSPERYEELTKTAYGVINEMKNKIVSDSNFNKFKEIVRREYEVNIKRNYFWSDEIKNIYWLNKDPNVVVKFEEFLDKITKEDIQNAAKLYLNDKRNSKFVKLPKEMKKD
jgi:zinc protease